MLALYTSGLAYIFISESGIRCTQKIRPILENALLKQIWSKTLTWFIFLLIALFCFCSLVPHPFWTLMKTLKPLHLAMILCLVLFLIALCKSLHWDSWIIHQYWLSHHMQQRITIERKQKEQTSWGKSIQDLLAS